jgi:Uma2 family endonuclease
MEPVVTMAAYLRTSYRPDCEFVDGTVVERNVGERAHSVAIRESLLFLAGRYPHLRERLLPGVKVRVGPTRIRVPDLCLLAGSTTQERVIMTPPSLCIEILASEDTFAGTLERVRDCLAMGVPTCWIIDPIKAQGWVATPGRLCDAADGVLRAAGIEMPISEVVE